MTDGHPFTFVMCLACGERYDIDAKAEPPGECGQCGEKHCVLRQYTPEGPYTAEEFGDLVARRTVRFVKGDPTLILNRLLATVVCGFAKP
jgi:hypothetical protein